MGPTVTGPIDPRLTRPRKTQASPTEALYEEPYRALHRGCAPHIALYAGRIGGQIAAGDSLPTSCPVAPR